MTTITIPILATDKGFEAELLQRNYEGPLNNFLSYYFRCTATDGQVIGVAIKLTDLVVDEWHVKGNDASFEGEDLNFCLRVLPKVFEVGSTDNKKQVTIVFHIDENVVRSEGVLYFQVTGNRENTARKYLYGGKVDNKKIQRGILSISYWSSQNDPHGYLQKKRILDMLPVTDIEAERNIKYLVESGFLKGSLTTAGYIMFKITKDGIDAFEQELANSIPALALPSPEVEPSTLYIKDQILDLIKKKNEGFNYKKLLQLINELNVNYLSKNPYACLSIIRAITDHVPPLLGYDSFEELVNNYQGPRTDKDYLFRLLDSRPVSDDSLHRPISNTTDLIGMDNLPNNIFLNRLLQESLEKTVNPGFRYKSELSVKQVSKVKKVTDTNLRPLIIATLTGISGSSKGYFIDIEFTNKGKGVALLTKFDFAGTALELGGRSLSEGEHHEMKNIQMDGTPLVKGEVVDPRLVIDYSNIDKIFFKTLYKIDLDERDDQLKNIVSLSDPEFTQL